MTNIQLARIICKMFCAFLIEATPQLNCSQRLYDTRNTFLQQIDEYEQQPKRD